MLTMSSSPKPRFHKLPLFGLCFWLALCSTSAAASFRPALNQKARSLSLINRRGPYLGLITVYPPKETAFFSTRAFKPDPKLLFLDLSGRRFQIGTVYGRRVVYIRCGIGMVNAAAATQQMADAFLISGIVHFGISGNLNNSMNIGDVFVPTQIADTSLWNWQNPDANLDPADIAHLKIGNFNMPVGDGAIQLGQIRYSPEQLYSSDSLLPNTPATVLWINVTRRWLHLAATAVQGEGGDGESNSTFLVFACANSKHAAGRRNIAGSWVSKFK